MHNNLASCPCGSWRNVEIANRFGFLEGNRPVRLKRIHGHIVSGIVHRLLGEGVLRCLLGLGLRSIFARQDRIHSRVALRLGGLCCGMYVQYFTIGHRRSTRYFAGTFKVRFASHIIPIAISIRFLSLGNISVQAWSVESFIPIGIERSIMPLGSDREQAVISNTCVCMKSHSGRDRISKSHIGS